MSPYVVDIVIVALIVGIIGVDVVLWKDDVDGNTFSERIRMADSRWWPVRLLAVFGMGLLTGHWFWT